MSENSLVGGLVITHGQLGRELLVAAQTIVGEIPHHCRRVAGLERRRRGIEKDS